MFTGHFIRDISQLVCPAALAVTCDHRSRGATRDPVDPSVVTGRRRRLPKLTETSLASRTSTASSTLRAIRGTACDEWLPANTGANSSHSCRVDTPKRASFKRRDWLLFLVRGIPFNEALEYFSKGRKYIDIFNRRRYIRNTTLVVVPSTSHYRYFLYRRAGEDRLRPAFTSTAKSSDRVLSEGCHADG